mmetsp:Transcript_90477/g.270015  ORF Transcript_90477/g.270015 Transcript_90477/m.270015 type:complete len:204 (+) Transcript_90477:44-655(+)
MSLQSGARWLKHCWSVAGTHGCAAALQMLARRWRILETRKAMLTTPPDLMLFDPVDKSSPRVQATPVHACAETATLDGLLSASECGRLIGFLESTGCFGPGDATLFGGETRVRSNDMLVWLAPRTVTDQLWDRVGLTAWPSGCGQAPVGLNSFVRCYRYRRGQAFLPHYDRLSSGTISWRAAIVCLCISTPPWTVRLPGAARR